MNAAGDPGQIAGVPPGPYVVAESHAGSASSGAHSAAHAIRKEMRRLAKQSRRGREQG